MNSQEIRNKYRKFIEKNGHIYLDSKSIIPENDPSTLFISSGVQTMIPYVLGEKHPMGMNIANIQKCVRTQDIDEVGDNTHDTFFEMIGYWSFGDYFKEKSIKQLYNFFIDEIGLDKNRIYVTCFEGDENSDKDTESAKIWKSMGIDESKIFFLGTNSNWWNVGDNGPCGPDTEVFYDISKSGLDIKNIEDFITADENQQIVEIANSVFMSYQMKDGIVVGKLNQKTVDMGSGFERLCLASQKKQNIFETDLFINLINEIKKSSQVKDYSEKEIRIIADHIRTSIFMLADGIVPSNSEAGYVLRRIIRRAIRILGKINSKKEIHEFINNAIEPYKEVYLNLEENKKNIESNLKIESDKFRKTLISGEKIISNVNSNLSGKEAFKIFSTYGFPIEIIEEILKERGLTVSKEEFEKEFVKHQEISKIGSKEKFKGGLSSTGEKEIMYHTATHLLHQALIDVLGNHINQRGSNITPERLRFDFSHTEKMTDEQKKKVEDIVNQKIKEALPINVVSLPKETALKTGAKHLFNDKYGDTVTVYYIGNDLESAYSKEFCGGPHVKNTSQLGVFTIKKEEASSQGVRRIKAVLE